MVSWSSDVPCSEVCPLLNNNPRRVQWKKLTRKSNKSRGCVWSGGYWSGINPWIHRVCPCLLKIGGFTVFVDLILTVHQLQSQETANGQRKHKRREWIGRKTGFPAATTATFAVPEHLAKYPVQQVLPSILLLLFLFFSGNYDRLFVHFKFFLISTDVRPLLYTFLPQHSGPCLSFEYIGQ